MVASVATIVGFSFFFTLDVFTLPTNKIIKIILSKLLTTYTIYGFIHFNFVVDYNHTFFLLQLLFIYFLDSVLSLIIKICD